jgi:hypothetical protein
MVVENFSFRFMLMNADATCLPGVRDYQRIFPFGQPQMTLSDYAYACTISYEISSILKPDCYTRITR